MYIKKLISVIIMWSLVISFFAYLKPLPVYADGFQFPFIQGKGEWSADCQGIRVYIEDKDGNRYKDDGSKNYCIDILQCSPMGNIFENLKGYEPYNKYYDESLYYDVDYTTWNDEYKPDKIYVCQNFEAFPVQTTYVKKNGKYEVSMTEYGIMTINNNISDIILKKYSSGENTKDEIKNIWRLLGIDQEEQKYLVEERKCYLVAEPLIWTNVPFSGGDKKYKVEDNVDNALYNSMSMFYDWELGSFTNKSGMVMVYGTLKDLIEFDENPTDNCIDRYQLFSGIRHSFKAEKDNGKRQYSKCYVNIGNGSEDIEVELWGVLYAMALSTDQSGGEKVADIFASYIRWYGNNERFDNADDCWYKYKKYHANDVNGDDLVSEETIQGLYDAIIEQGYYQIKCKTDILVSTVNGPYMTDSDVYTTVKLKNISGNDINIGNITSQFSASYPIEIIDSSGTNAFNTTHLADNETACISIKWHTPSSPTTLNFTADIYQENNDPTAVIVSPVEFDVEIENQTSEEDSSNIGADISDVFDVNKKIKEKYDSIYSVPYYENTIKENIKKFQNEYGLDESNEYHSEAVSAPEFVKDNQIFRNNLNFDGYPLDIRSYISADGKIYDGNTIKSGYGIGISLDYNGNNDMMTYKSAKLIVLYPEYGYDMKYASVGDYSEIYNKYMIKSNPVSSYESSNEKSRVHFIPEWWQDNTEYKIYWILTDMWTPSGEICIWGNISFNIDGSFYDDWYITRNIGDD